MDVRQMRRWTGAFGVAGFVVFLIALPLYFVGPQPMGRLEDSAQFAAAVHKVSSMILARTALADPLILACLVIFLTGFSRLTKRTRPGHDWIATVVFGAGLVVITLDPAGDALAGGAALDTSVKADPTVARGLWEGSIVCYGAIGLCMSGLLVASVGYAAPATGVPSRWIGWLACVCALSPTRAFPNWWKGV